CVCMTIYKYFTSCCASLLSLTYFIFLFLIPAATTEIYTLSLHDALPILTVNAGNGGFLHCIQMDTSVNAANQVVSVGADIAFDADPKFFACLVRFESSSVPTTLPTAYDVYPLDGRHDGGYYTVKD